MKRQLSAYLIAEAVLIVALAMVQAPLVRMLLTYVVLACPLMVVTLSRRPAGRHGRARTSEPVAADLTPW